MNFPDTRIICRHLVASFLAIVTPIAPVLSIADGVATPAARKVLLAGIGARGVFDGCNVYRFEDLARGKLERQRRGQLVIAQTVRGIPGTHHGACAAHARLKGILLSQIVSTAAPRTMQIRQSGVELP